MRFVAIKLFTPILVLIIIIPKSLRIGCQFLLYNINQGKVVFDGESKEIVQQLSLFDELGISAPPVLRLGKKLEEDRFYSGSMPLDVDQAEKMVKEVLSC